MDIVAKLYAARVGTQGWRIGRNSRARYLTGVLALVVLSGCASVEKVKDQINNRLGGGEATTESAQTTLSEQAESPPISKKEQMLTSIQQNLDKLGYAPGRSDGKMDSQTEAAIQDFQLDNDLRINGRPSAALLEKLENALSKK